MSDQANKVSFESLDLGSGKPISVPVETVSVQISSLNLLGSYARAFVKEAYRVNPLRAEQIELSESEVESYCNYLLTQRIAAVKGTCNEWRKLKALYIPSWIQYNLSMIGIVVLRDRGLRLVPEMENPSSMTYEQALSISEKIGMLIDDLQIVRDAMPRGDEGNVDVMSTALIADYVRALEPVEHVASTYVTAFLGIKLKEEAAMQVLYRVQYDDYAFIASALTTQRGLY